MGGQLRDGSEVGLAVIGCGRWGLNHVRVWRDLGCLRVVSDLNAGALASVSSQWPEIETSSDLSATLTRPDVTALVIATPAITHAALALQAMLAGKDVLVEKPMAMTVSEGQRLLETSVRLGRVLAVGHLLDHHPAVQKLFQLIHEGTLGRIRYVYANRLNFGQIRTEESALWSFAPHDIAIILRIVGQLPAEVACSGGAYVSDGVADVSLTSMRFPIGVQAHVFVSWLHPYKEHRLVVVGDQQMAVLDDTAPWPEKLTLYPHDVEWLDGRLPVARRAVASHVSVVPDEPLRVECADFLNCLTSRQRPRADARSGLDTVQVLEAAQRSLESGGGPCALTGTKDPEAQVHPTASVHPTVRIGASTRIWHQSTVLEGASIGEGSMLGQNTFVGRGVHIGDGVRIQNNVSVYEGVELEDDVFCGPSVVFTNVQRPRSHVDRKQEFQPTIVRRGATLGANCTVISGVTIGRYAFVAAGAVVSRDVPDHALVIGSPARLAGWVCVCGEKLAFNGARATCVRCSAQFVESEEGGARLLRPATGDGSGQPA